MTFLNLYKLKKEYFLSDFNNTCDIFVTKNSSRVAKLNKVNNLEIKMYNLPKF